MKNLGIHAPLIAFLSFALGSCAYGQTKRALLIGIENYAPDNPPSLPSCPVPGGALPADSRFSGGAITWQNLHGPSNDVQSMRLLLEQKYGFTNVTVLPPDQATREGILRAIDVHLIRDTKPGDLTVFYFSGHGSLRLNSKSTKVDHMDETIVASDAYKCAYDVRDKELAQRFNQILARKAKLVAIFDSCHSGTQARGLKSGVSRALLYDNRDVAADPKAYDGTDLDQVPAQGDAIILTAALSTQNAQEQMFTDDHLVHGVFTKALVATLQNATRGWRAVDVLDSVQAYLRADEWEQQPTIEGRAEESLFGDSSDNHKLRTSVTKTLSDGVQLNVGSIAEFDIGTQFTSLNNGMNGKPVVLEITRVDSAISSTAKIVSGQMDFKGGERFELSKLVIATDAKLRVFVPGLGIPHSNAQIPSIVKSQFASMKWVDDPAESPFYLVTRAQDVWRAIGPGGKTDPKPSASTSDVINQPSKAFLGIPPPPELIDAFESLPAFKNGAVTFTRDLSSAQYLLLGRESKMGGTTTLQFAMVSPSAFGIPPKVAYVINPKSRVACSTDTSMPIRGPWATTETTTYDGAAAEIASFATKIAKLRSWTQLTTVSQPSGAWPYRLSVAVHSESGVKELTPEDTLSPGTTYDIVLAADPDQLAKQPVDPKFVYIVGFDCSGSSILLYPTLNMGGGAPLPTLADGRPAPRITLKTIRVGEPFGADTIFMLVTDQKITDLSIFDFDGVLASRGLSSNPLEQLVRGLGAASSRGMDDVPMDWTVQKIVIASRPQKQ